MTDTSTVVSADTFRRVVTSKTTGCLELRYTPRNPILDAPKTSMKETSCST